MASYDDRFLNRSEYTAPPQIIDNLTSDNPNAALSARQGKALKTDVQQLHATISTLNTTSNQVVTKLDGASINKCSFVGKGSGHLYFTVSAGEYLYRFNTSSYSSSGSNPNSNIEYPYFYNTIISTKGFKGFDIKAHKIERNITEYTIKNSQFLGSPYIQNSYVGHGNGISFIHCAAYSPTLKKICFGGSGMLIGYIDATNGSVDINVSSLTQSFSNMNQQQFIAWCTNHQVTLGYTYHGCSINRIKWCPSINKFIALTGYGNSHGYNGAFLVLESSDGINWTVHSTPYLINDFVYCESINKFIGLRPVYQTKIVNVYPNNMGGVQQNASHNMYNFGLVISDDAINWNTVIIDYPSYVLDNTTNGGIIMTGISWSNRLNKLIITGSRMPLTNNGMLCYQEQHKTPFILSTSNGTNFTFTQSLDYGTDMPIYKVLWVDDANLFFGIVGNLVLVSADGINWYKYNTPPTDTYRAIPQYGGSGIYGVSANDTVYDDIFYHKHTKHLYFTAVGNKAYDMLLKL